MAPRAAFMAHIARPFSAPEPAASGRSLRRPCRARYQAGRPAKEGTPLERPNTGLASEVYD